MIQDHNTGVAVTYMTVPHKNIAVSNFLLNKSINWLKHDLPIATTVKFGKVQIYSFNTTFKNFYIHIKQIDTCMFIILQSKYSLSHCRHKIIKNRIISYVHFRIRLKSINIKHIPIIILAKGNFSSHPLSVIDAKGIFAASKISHI